MKVLCTHLNRLLYLWDHLYNRALCLGRTMTTRRSNDDILLLWPWCWHLYRWNTDGTTIKRTKNVNKNDDNSPCTKQPCADVCYWDCLHCYYNIIVTNNVTWTDPRNGKTPLAILCLQTSFIVMKRRFWIPGGGGGSRQSLDPDNDGDDDDDSDNDTTKGCNNSWRSIRVRHTSLIAGDGLSIGYDVGSRYSDLVGLEANAASTTKTVHSTNNAMMTTTTMTTFMTTFTNAGTGGRTWLPQYDPVTRWYL